MKRRERVSITAYSDHPDVKPITVEGQLSSFQLNTRLTYDLGGKRMRSSDDKIEVVVTMYLDPEDARIFRDRNRPRVVQRLVTHGERLWRESIRGLTLLYIGSDVATYWQTTGKLPPSRMLTERARSTLHVCRECDSPPHFDECPDCFGFGVSYGLDARPDAAVPIAAGDAYDLRNEREPKDWQWYRCRTCGSTIYGVPSVP